MPNRSRTSVPRILARSIGYGVTCGAALGISSVAVLVLPLSLPANELAAIGDVIMFAPLAGVIGGVMGLLVGLFGGVALIVTGVAEPGSERLARPVAGVAAAIPFLTLALAGCTGSLEDDAWVIGGWLWLFVVGLMSGGIGAAVGPRVVGLERNRGSADLRTCWPRTLFCRAALR